MKPRYRGKFLAVSPVALTTMHYRFCHGTRSIAAEQRSRQTPLRSVLKRKEKQTRLEIDDDSIDRWLADADGYWLLASPRSSGESLTQRSTRLVPLDPRSTSESSRGQIGVVGHASALRGNWSIWYAGAIARVLMIASGKVRPTTGHPGININRLNASLWWSASTSRCSLLWQIMACLLVQLNQHRLDPRGDRYRIRRDIITRKRARGW